MNPEELIQKLREAFTAQSKQAAYLMFDEKGAESEIVQLRANLMYLAADALHDTVTTARVNYGLYKSATEDLNTAEARVQKLQDDIKKYQLMLRASGGMWDGLLVANDLDEVLKGI